MISVVTPWRDHVELIPAYEMAMAGLPGGEPAQVVIVDNASAPENARRIEAMVKRLGGVYIRNDENRWFSAACNQGLERASGEIVLFLNNDIMAGPFFLPAVARDTAPGLLVGPSNGVRVVAGQPLQYIEGWCIAARREVWGTLGGWDAATFPLPYWEDIDLSWRALRAGFKLKKAAWDIGHISNTTSGHTPGAYSASDRNRQVFTERFLAWQQSA